MPPIPTVSPTASSSVSTSALSSQDWDLFRIFLAVARSGSIASAASQLAESSATVGRKLRELEALLSATVFDRSVSGVTLTPAGTEILRKAEQIELQVMQISDAISGTDGQLTGMVTVAAPSGLGQVVLAPALRELHNLHPRLRVRLLLATSRVNLLNRDADIALRIGTPTQDRLIASQLGDVGFGIYAARDYLDDLDGFDGPDDLSGHNVIAASGDLAKTVQSQEFATLSTACHVAAETDSIFAQLEAVKSGLGLAPLPTYLAASHPDLVEVLPGQLRNRAALWLLAHPDSQSLARVKTVHDFIADICRNSARI